VPFLEVSLYRGAVVDGRVYDDSGLPVDAARVILSRKIRLQGQEAQKFGQTWVAATNDLGYFRFYGLPAGDYSITIVPSSDGGYLDPIQPERSGTPLHVPNRVGLLPMALEVNGVELGVDRTVNAQLSRGVTPSIAGMVTTVDRIPVSGIRVTAEPGAESGLPSLVRRTTSTNPDGGFRIDGVLPGTYQVTAVNLQSGIGMARWGMSTVVVGAGRSTVNVELRPGAAVDGRLASDDATTTLPISLITRGLRLMGPVGPVGPPHTDPKNLRFEFSDLQPGRYYFDFLQMTSMGWYLVSVKDGNGQDVQVVELISGAAIKNLVLSFTNKPTELRGRILDSTNTPSSDYGIVVFPSEPRLWTTSGLLRRKVAPSLDGTYSVKGLPPGKYLIAVVTMDLPIDTNPQLLAELVPFAIPFTLKERDVLVQDLRIR
jgi:hypothetical protein